MNTPIFDSAKIDNNGPASLLVCINGWLFCIIGLLILSIEIPFCPQ